MTDKEYEIALLEEVTEKLDELRRHIIDLQEEGEDTAEEAAGYFKLQQSLEGKAIELLGYYTDEIADAAVKPESKWIN